MGGAILIIGEAGLGKSRLSQEVKTIANSLLIITLYGGADLADKSTPYFAFRTLFKQIFQKLVRCEHWFTMVGIQACLFEAFYKEKNGSR